MKNWKTTLAGLALAILGALAQQPGTIGKIGSIGTAISAIALGASAKDRNVTGGTVRQ